MNEAIEKVVTRSFRDEYSTGDQTIILGLHIFLVNRSSKTIDQKILMTLPPFPSPLFDLSSSLEVVRMSSESNHRLFVFLSFCLSVFECSPLFIGICLEAFWFLCIDFLYFCLFVLLSFCLRLYGWMDAIIGHRSSKSTVGAKSPISQNPIQSY